MEVSVQNSWTWLGVALGIPRNAEYPQKVLPKGTSTSWNVLEITYHFADDFADDSMWPLFSRQHLFLPLNN
jgi:hypothetical protein